MTTLSETTTSLVDLLKALTKDHLHSMRKSLHISGASQLNKNELVQLLHAHIVGNATHYLERMDHNRYSLLKKVMDAPGSLVPYSKLQDSAAYEEPNYYQMYGLLFLMGDTVIMPLEIREALLRWEPKRRQTILDRNTEWIRLTQGLLYYYGCVSVEKLTELVQKYTGQSVDRYEYELVIRELESYDWSVLTTAYGFTYFTVEDPAPIVQEQRSRPQLDYYPFTKQQVLRASADEFVDRHVGYKRLVAFLQKNWEIASEDADLIAAELMDEVQQGAGPAEITAHLQEQLQFSGMEQLQELVDVSVSFMNHTRQWGLKGYAPEELFREEKKHLKPLPQHPFRSPHEPSANVSSAGTVYSFVTGEKIGRNDPCPCGSGRKYKKCCGT